MKKVLILVLLAVMLAASGCVGAESIPTDTAAPDIVEETFTPVPLEESVFWNFGAEQEEYKEVFASHCINWATDGLNVSFYVSPSGLSMNDLWEYTDTETKNGTEYAFAYMSLYWDDFENQTGGRKDTAKMRWRSSGYDYLLVGYADDETVSLDFVNTDTAVKLESGDLSVFKRLEPAGEIWRSEFRSTFEIVTLQVYTPPADKAIKEEIAKGRLKPLEASGYEYCFYEEHAPDGTYITNTVWKTNIGYVVLSETIPAMYSDEIQFVNERDSFGNVINITEQLCAKILPLPKS